MNQPITEHYKATKAIVEHLSAMMMAHVISDIDGFQVGGEVDGEIALRNALTRFLLQRDIQIRQMVTEIVQEQLAEFAGKMNVQKVKIDGSDLLIMTNFEIREGF